MNRLRLARASAAAAAMSFLCACTNIPLGPSSPARTDALFAQVARGMPESEVASLLGRPDETMSFPRSNTVAWDYRYYDTWGYLAVYSVTFGPDGRVVSTLSNRLNSGGDHSGSR